MTDKICGKCGRADCNCTADVQLKFKRSSCEVCGGPLRATDPGCSCTALHDSKPDFRVQKRRIMSAGNVKGLVDPRRIRLELDSEKNTTSPKLWSLKKEEWIPCEVLGILVMMPVEQADELPEHNLENPEPDDDAPTPDKPS